jgi:hypothetical protein
VPLPASRLPKTIVSVIDDEKMLAIRAGTGPHRFIGIWAVVVEGRVFVRSWSLEPRSWYRTFREDSVGAIQVRGRTVRVRARFPTGDRLLDAVSEAYAAKYHTPGSLEYVRDLARARSRATTTELVPLGAGRTR